MKKIILTDTVREMLDEALKLLENKEKNTAK